MTSLSLLAGRTVEVTKEGKLHVEIFVLVKITLGKIASSGIELNR